MRPELLDVSLIPLTFWACACDLIVIVVEVSRAATRHVKRFLFHFASMLRSYAAFCKERVRQEDEVFV